METQLNPNEICLPRKLTNQMLHWSQLSPDTEICGLIGADLAGMPQSCYPVNNCADIPQQRFLLDAKQQIDVMRQMREKGETLFAIYHSHPTTPAEPSQADLEQSAYPEALNLIISLNTKGVLELRAYRIIQKSWQELSIIMIEA